MQSYFPLSNYTSKWSILIRILDRRSFSSFLCPRHDWSFFCLPHSITNFLSFLYLSPVLCPLSLPGGILRHSAHCAQYLVRSTRSPRTRSSSPSYPRRVLLSCQIPKGSEGGFGRSSKTPPDPRKIWARREPRSPRTLETDLRPAAFVVLNASGDPLLAP